MEITVIIRLNLAAWAARVFIANMRNIAGTVSDGVS